MLPAFITVMLWSCSAVASARSAALIGAARANRLRLVAATLVLAGLGWLAAAPAAGSAAGWFLLSGAIGLGLGDLAMFWAYEKVGSRLVVLITQCGAVPLAGLLEWLWLGNAMSLTEILLCAVILAGVAMALLPGCRLAASTRDLRLGVLGGLGSAIGLACAGVVSRRAYAAADLSGLDLHSVAGGLTAALWRNLGGVAILFALAALWPLARRAAGGLTGRWRAAPAADRAPDWRRGWPWLLATSLLGPSLGVACYQWALAQEKAALVQATLALVPVVVMPLAWAVEGDRPRLLSWIGGAIAVAGAVAMALTHHA